MMTKSSHRRWVAWVALCLVILTAGAGVAACGGSSAGPAASPSLIPFAAPTATPSATPSASPSTTPAPVSKVDVRGSLLVVRTDRPKRWAVWRITPRIASQTRLVLLSFKPATATANPSGTRVAYMSTTEARPRIAIVDAATGATREIKTAGHGFKHLNGLVWTSDTTLLAVESADSPFYATSTGTGPITAFRGITAGGWSVAPRADRLINETATTLQAPTEANGYVLIVREDVFLAQLRQGESAHVILSSTYEAPAARQDFASPMLSPNGRLLLTAMTGSDVRATYHLRDLSGTLYFSRFTPTNFVAAWSSDSNVVAIAGQTMKPDASGDYGTVWIYHVDAHTFTTLRPGRSQSGAETYPSSLGWSRSGDLVIGLMGSGRHAPQVLVAPKGKQSGLTNVTTGSLPVWVK
jgi:hypothetical protein